MLRTRCSRVVFRYRTDLGISGSFEGSTISGPVPQRARRTRKAAAVLVLGGDKRDLVRGRRYVTPCRRRVAGSANGRPAPGLDGYGARGQRNDSAAVVSPVICRTP